MKILYRIKQVGSSVRIVKQKPRKWETGTRQKCGQTSQVEREVVSGNRACLLGQTQFNWVKTTQCHQLHSNFSQAAPWDMENDGWISGPGIQEGDWFHPGIAITSA